MFHCFSCVSLFPKTFTKKTRLCFSFIVSALFPRFTVYACRRHSQKCGCVWVSLLHHCSRSVSLFHCFSFPKTFEKPLFQFHCFGSGFAILSVFPCVTASFFCLRHSQNIHSFGPRVCFSFTVSAVVLQFRGCFPVSQFQFFYLRHSQKIHSFGPWVCFSFTVSAVVLQFGRCQLTKVFLANRETQNISYCTHPPFVPCRHTIKCEKINLNKITIKR